MHFRSEEYVRPSAPWTAPAPAEVRRLCSRATEADDVGTQKKIASAAASWTFRAVQKLEPQVVGITWSINIADNFRFSSLT